MLLPWRMAFWNFTGGYLLSMSVLQEKINRRRLFGIP